jgi:hypothetical protein
MLLALAAGVRALAWQRTAVLFDDGPVFIYLAQAMAEGDWSAVVRHPYHPLYSLALWWMQGWVGDYEQAGALVSILSGATCVGLLFAFLREAFDSRSAVIGAGLLAIHPASVAFTSDVQSDGLYAVFFLGSAWLAWRALRDVSVGLAGVAGLLAGFAYLVRPEGLGVALAAIAGAGWLAITGAWGRRRAALWCASVALGAGLVAAPYVVAIHAETGVWTLTQKKSVAALAGFERAQPAAASAAQPSSGLHSDPVRPPQGADRGTPVPTSAERFAAAVPELASAALSGLRIELVSGLLVGLWLTRGRLSHRGLFIAAVIGLYAAVLFALGASAGYVSRRHVLPPLLLLFGYVALGLPEVASWVLRSVARLIPGWQIPRRQLSAVGWPAAVISVFVVATFFLPTALEARRVERVAERRAAEWLRGTADAPRVVASRRQRVAYYAGASHVPIPTGGYPPGELLRYLRERGALHLIIDDGSVERLTGLREPQELGMEALYRAEAGGRSAAVYSILPQSGS